MSFSAGHFTIFSAEKRENLHGHNFSVYVALEAEVKEHGLTFDYNIYKQFVIKLCHSLDEVVLLPAESIYLKFEEVNEYIHTYFNQETIIFLKRDVKILPLQNITVEELSYWFLQKLLFYAEKKHGVNAIEIKVFSGSGQSGASFWSKSHEK